MFITKEHYNALLGYRDIALKTIQEAECVNATNKQVCDFNKRLIEELRKTRTEVAREIFEEMQVLLMLRMGVNEVIAELKKKYTEEKT